MQLNATLSRYTKFLFPRVTLTMVSLGAETLVTMLKFALLLNAFATIVSTFLSTRDNDSY